MSLASNTRLIVCDVFFPGTLECNDCHLWTLCNVGGRQNDISCFLAAYELGAQMNKRLDLIENLLIDLNPPDSW